MKLRLIAAGMAALGLSASLAFAQTAPQTPPELPPVNKPVLSYGHGYQLGRILAEQNADVDVNQLIRGVQEGLAKKDPSYPDEQIFAQLEAYAVRIRQAQEAEMAKISRENKTKSDAFLATNRSKQGIQTLPSGTQYRVIEAGNGARPTATSTVKLHFRISSSNGREFLSTYSAPEPQTVQLGGLPDGLREAITQMPAGSRWEVFALVPDGLSMRGRPMLAPNDIAVYDVKLISVE